MSPLEATIVQSARELFNSGRFHPPETFHDLTRAKRGSCLHWAGMVIVAAAIHGRRLIIQGGTASWRRLKDADDDGVQATHFTFEARDGVDPAPFLARGILPEMHVWAADPWKQQIVDLTTSDLPALCESLGKMPWRADPPPDVLWAGADEFPDGWHYKPLMEPTLLAGALLHRELATAEQALRLFERRKMS